MSLTSPAVYRDGQCLVVPLDAAELPPCCLWTNAPTDGETREFTIVDPKAGYEFGVAYGVRTKTDRRKVRLPVSKSWAGDKDAKKVMMSRRLMSVSAPLLIVGIAVVGGMLALMTGQQLSSTSAMVTFFVFTGLGGLGLLGMVIGFALPYLDEVPGADFTLRVDLITDTHFWLPNAHHEMLAAAPAWSGPSRDEVRRSRPGFWQSLGRAWPVLAAWLVAVIAVAVIRALIRAGG